MTDIDNEPGRDLESRAALYRAVQLGAALDEVLRRLAPEASARIGVTDEMLDAVGGLRHIVSRALWASTADLQQAGQFEFADRVVARATELAVEEES